MSSDNIDERLGAVTPALSPPARTGSSFRKYAIRYGLSVASLLIPMAVTVALKGHPNLYPIISACFLLVISAASWWAGMWAGILVTCLTVPALTVAASGGTSWFPSHIDAVGILIFCFISFLVGKVANTRNKIEEVLRTANSELESKVQERTAAVENANTAIQHRFAELEFLYAQLPVGLCFLDTNLCFLRINHKLAAINNSPAADHLHRHLKEMMPSTTADVLEPLYRKVLETGDQIHNLEINESNSDDPDQQRTWLIDCAPVKAADGMVLGLQVILHDITERKRSERLLLRAHGEVARREKELRTLANAMPQICWVSNADGSVAWYNDRWYEYTGIPHGEIRPGQWEATIHPELLPPIVERWKTSLIDCQGLEMELLIRGLDERYRWFLVRTIPVLDDEGEIERWFGTSTDIDELKRSREALVASERELRLANSDLQQFAYSASHDLQEPIRTTALYSQLLQRRYGALLEGDGKKFLDFVCTSAQRMETLVRDLLQYVETAHVEEATMELTAAGDALGDALASLSATLEEAKGKVAIDTLPTLKIRRTHLQQVFQNLLSNALKYRGAEYPQIHVSAHRHDRQWVLSVQDNGIGIDPAYTESIFGIFKRLHTVDKYPGTGMGLAICQRILERYGGRIWIESELGKGSTFFFTIP